MSFISALLLWPCQCSSPILKPRGCFLAHAHATSEQLLLFAGGLGARGAQLLPSGEPGAAPEEGCAGQEVTAECIQVIHFTDPEAQVKVYTVLATYCKLLTFFLNS